MSNYTRRLVLAFCLSATCYFATEDWYQRTKNTKINRSGHEPIAQLQDLKNEVQRKPLTRVIWETISKDEDLFTGEAVRTHADAEAKIVFLKTGTQVELEPDSLVVLEENEKGVLLDFLKGHLFIKENHADEGEKSEKNKITLKSGKNEINLQNADISLSKSSTDQLDIEVFSGTAQLKNENKTLTLSPAQSVNLEKNEINIDKNNIHLISPLVGDPIYVDIKNKEKIRFQWTKVDHRYRVHLKSGENRKNLLKTSDHWSGGDTETLSAAAKIGKSFWQLVGEPSTPDLPIIRSTIFPLVILPKRPPIPLEPISDASISLQTVNNKTVRFKWANPAKLEHLLIEVAKDSSLKQQILKEPIDEKTNFKDLPIESSGDFFWRITGFLRSKNKMIPISSEISHFSIDKIKKELQPPSLHSPTNHQNFNHDVIIDKGLTLIWNVVPETFRYEILIEIKNANKEFTSILNKELVSNQFQVDELSPGLYRWTVRSIGENQKKSSYAPFYNFSINEISYLEWANGPQEERYFYVTPKPSLILAWVKPIRTPASIKKWQYRLSKDKNKLDEADWRFTESNKINEALSENGEYFAEVEALNEKNKVIARSSIKSIVIAPQPLLAPPSFSSELPPILKASRKGDFTAQWEPVPEAKKYQITLRDLKGKTIRKEIVKSTNFQLQKLKPGEYEISLQSLDQHDRIGPIGSTRRLEVPKVSDIAAPKLKTIQVK